MTQTLQNANTDLRCAIRELQEQKTMSEPANLKPITRIPGMQYAVREVEEKAPDPSTYTVSVTALNDLKAEYAKLATERNDLKTERDALLAKSRERADRSGEEYAKSVDYTGLREAVERLGTHTHAGPSPDFLEDTQLPSATPDLDPEVLAISEVLGHVDLLVAECRAREDEADGIVRISRS